MVKAVVTSIDARKLQCLKLDHLQDEGALPNGEPMPQDLAIQHSHNEVNPYGDEGIEDELLVR